MQRFGAYLFDGRGREHRSDVHDTREAAANQLLARFPKVRDCATAVATVGADNKVNLASDVRWRGRTAKA